MAPRNRPRLTPIEEDTVLEHGMSFVVKWRNPATNRIEFWIGIYVMENLSFAIRRPKVAADEDPEDNDKYLMYLPGRNT